MCIYIVARRAEYVLLRSNAHNLGMGRFAGHRIVWKIAMYMYLSLRKGVQ